MYIYIPLLSPDLLALDVGHFLPSDKKHATQDLGLQRLVLREGVLYVCVYACMHSHLFGDQMMWTAATWFKTPWVVCIFFYVC